VRSAGADRPRGAEAAAPPLVVSGLSKSFGEAPDPVTPVIADLGFALRAGEIVSLVGPSGCGKSTLLNVLCGLLPASSGEIRWYGAPLRGVPDHVGYMLQKDMLLPWRTAAENVTLGLEIKAVGRAEAKARARHLLTRLGLDGFGEAYPTKLSGGMRQRVALARTLAPGPRVLLLDEPFAALDFQTKLVLEGDMARMVRDDACALLLITHDVEEAVSLSDRVVVLTHRPCRIKAVHEIDLPGDRTDMMAARGAPQFAELVRTIWNELEIQTR
jgi:NitT/TauT family transport system ATP-binding protein